MSNQNIPSRFPFWSIMVLAIVVGVGHNSIRHFLHEWQFKDALKSYAKHDCASAVEKFDRLVNYDDYGSAAKEKITECEFFQDAIKLQKEGKFEPASINYAKLTFYENSDLLAPAERNLEDLLKKANIPSLATINLCSRIDRLDKSYSSLKSIEQTPLLYIECGKKFESKQKYNSATAIYEKFLENYPNHPSKDKIKSSLARSIVADIKSKGAAKINSPGRVGSTFDGSTVVEIQNSSPAKMQITFSGVTPKFEQIESCRDCQKYTGEGPKYCPQEGQTVRYTLEPGQYDIAVKSTADDGNPVNPWVGTWSLEAGNEYQTCFFIVQNPIKDLEKKESIQ